MFQHLRPNHIIHEYLISLRLLRHHESHRFRLLYHNKLIILTFCHINKYNVTESARVRDHVNVDP